MKIFAVVNGDVLEDLGMNTTPTLTRIHFLLSELKKSCKVEVLSIGFRLSSKRGLRSTIYNNLLKSIAALQSALLMGFYRPKVYFAYPHSLTTPQNRVLFRFCRMLDLDIILDIHDTMEQGKAVGAGRFLLKEPQEEYFIKNSTYVLVLNEFMWSHLKERYNIAQDIKAVIVPNAYEDSFCKLYPHAYMGVEGRFNICYLGGLTKNRGIDILVEACQGLHQKFPYLRLYIFGSYQDGSDLQLRNAIERSDFIQRRIVPRKELLSSLNEVDLFVMPYNPMEPYMNFSSPTKLYEYIGTGKPILCTKCESILELGKDGGIVYVDNDPVDLEKKAEMLILNPEIMEKLSRELIRMRPQHTRSERAKTVYLALQPPSGTIL